MRQSRCVARWKRSSAPPESPPTETAERARQRAHHPAHHPDPHLPSGFPLREQQVLYFSHKGDFLDISIKHQGTCIMANHTSPRTPVAPTVVSRGVRGGRCTVQCGPCCVVLRCVVARVYACAHLPLRHRLAAARLGRGRHVESVEATVGLGHTPYHHLCQRRRGQLGRHRFSHRAGLLGLVRGGRWRRRRAARVHGLVIVAQRDALRTQLSELHLPKI